MVALGFEIQYGVTPMEIEIRILFFARARELAGRDRLELSLPAGARLQDAVAALAERIPRLKAYLDHCRLAVDQEFEGIEKELRHGAEVAVIPPVSGGAHG